MSNMNNDIVSQITSQFFNKVLNSSNLQIVEFDALLSILIKTGIPFDVEFTPGTRRDSAAATLTIYINPNTTLNLTFNFDGGGESIFTGARGVGGING